MYKTCKSCGISKPHSEYHKHQSNRDRLCGKCKSCWSDYERSRANNPNRVAARKAYAETEEGKRAANEAKARYIERNPHKRKAHEILGNAIRDGKVSPLPCFVCGEEAEAHHSSYDFPLGVTWLCDKHHKETHKMHRAIERERSKLAV